MSTSAKSSYSSPSLWRRLDVRFPWLKIIMVITLVVAAALDLLGLTISVSYSPRAEVLVAPMTRHVKITEWDPEGKKLVALTFDDGPSSTTTPRLLQILADKNVPATFFMLGYKVANNPGLARQVEAAGHEVASHTMYHQNLIRISNSSAKSDISAARNALRSALGHSPTLTRAPYGNYNATVREAVGTPLIMWSVDTLDWKYRNTESIVSCTTSQIYDGAIILMHDIHPTSVDAVPTLVDTLRAAGYEFVTVSDLAKRRGVKMTSSGVYYGFKL